MVFPALIDDTELLALSLATEALTGIPVGTRDIQRQAASDYIRGRLAPRISAFGNVALTGAQISSDVKEAIAARASFTLLGRRGFNPTAGSDKSVKDRHDAMLQWLTDVWEGRIEILGYPIDRQGPKVGGTGTSSWERWRLCNTCNCNPCNCFSSGLC